MPAPQTLNDAHLDEFSEQWSGTDQMQGILKEMAGNSRPTRGFKQAIAG